MSAKASHAGWVVQVTSPNKDDAPEFAFFNVAIGDPDMAVEATRKRVGAVDGDRVYAVRPLTEGEVSAIKLKAGEVKPA